MADDKTKDGTAHDFNTDDIPFRKFGGSRIVSAVYSTLNTQQKRAVNAQVEGELEIEKTDPGFKQRFSDEEFRNSRREALAGDKPLVEKLQRAAQKISRSL